MDDSYSIVVNKKEVHGHSQDAVVLCFEKQRQGRNVAKKEAESNNFLHIC